MAPWDDLRTHLLELKMHSYPAHTSTSTTLMWCATVFQRRATGSPTAFDEGCHVEPVRAIEEAVSNWKNTFLKAEKKK